MPIKFFYNKKHQKVLGLRIAVKTYKGTRDGVPALSTLLSENNASGTFFFSIGPDNSGRNLWRLLNPFYLIKIFRENAIKLYGLNAIFKGLLWPGPDIGLKLSETLKAIQETNHEVALYALDQHKWQMNISKYSKEKAENEIVCAMEKWNNIFGKLPQSAGNPSWQLSSNWLDYFETDYAHKLLYRSDCRGSEIGYPEIDNKTYSTLQIPTTLPTFDEAIGSHGVNEYNYNKYILDKILPGQLNVLTINAEVEGISYYNLFKDFIIKCRLYNIEVVPLIELYKRNRKTKNIFHVSMEKIAGREGKLAVLRKK